mmetsp:Transcript_26366/g.33214  ORF Transcript_26366/g.33214 Transcript_26366/m.33214 type:complete len:247 (-) Transcript_26366:18-758(-)
MIVQSRSLKQTALKNQHLFLVSSLQDGIIRQKHAQEKLKASVCTLGSKERIRLLYIPTASYAIKRTSTVTKGLQRQRARRDGKAKRDAMCQLLSDFSFSIDAVTLDFWDESLKQATSASAWKCDSAVEALDTAHIILVDGGNTFWLWQNIERFSNRIQRVPIYIGVSAGAIVAGRHISVALWKGWDDPDVIRPPRSWKSVRGLDLAKGASFFPHHNESQWGSLVARERFHHEPLVTLNEDEAFIIQ